MAQVELFSYFNGDSRLHKLHPTLKIILLSIISFSIINGTKIELGYYLLIILIGILTSGIKGVVKELKYLLFIAISLVVFQVILADDISIAGFKSTLIYLVRFSEIILVGTLFTGTTLPQDMTPGIYNIIRNSKIAENISLTIKLVPTFIISWRGIEETLNSRGLYIRRCPMHRLIYITIPLIVETFRKSDALATAMDSRCYNGWIKEECIENKIDLTVILLVIIPHLLKIGMLLLQGL